MPRIIGITGSRPPKESSRREDFNRLIGYGVLWAESLPTDGSVLLIHGDAEGIDKTIGQHARSRGVWVQPFPAPWEQFTRLGMKWSAGFTRNGVLAQICSEVYAFWDGRSTGTRDMIDRAIVAASLCGLWLPSGKVECGHMQKWQEALAQAGVKI